ncbi:Predicted arabinose efflux permease, MFS family [Amycolatopsis lurida]|uniref:MFS transporter n=1 Tax=Amycolatopsis lurida TaxID=31959 RepID=UPI00089C5F5B|nr:MFS transporter [Amycolatopsis lurida]SEC40214.1 Predicted arabinose efflux permease, MFS family [Amycolatopsis lurida]
MLALIVTVAFLVAVDNTIVAAAAGSIVADLGTGIGLVPWLGLGYALPFATLLVFAGPVIDRFGARMVLRWGGAGFTLGAFLAATARASAPLMAGRVVQGVAAAAIVPATLTLLRSALPPARRTTGAAGWLAALACGLAGGPVLGGALSQYLHWRWVFWAVLACAVVVLLLSGAAPAGLGERAPRLRRALPELMRHRALTGSLLLQAFWGVGVTGVAFFTPLAYGELFGVGPGAAALPLVIVALALIAATPFVGRAVNRLGAGAPVAGGLAMVTVGLGTLAVLGNEPEIVPRLVSLALVGFGSAFTAPLATQVLEVAPSQLAGTAAGLLSASRELSGAVGVGLSGALVAIGPLVDGYTRALALSAVLTAVAALLATRLLLPRTPTK